MLIPVDTPDANSRITNLKRAIEDYVAEYNICKCKPCQNGGTLALIDGKCICMCSGEFEGLACQNFKADKAQHQGKEVQYTTLKLIFLLTFFPHSIPLIPIIFNRFKACCSSGG